MTNKTKLPLTPKGLSVRSAKLWRDVNARYEFSDAQLALLRESLLALSRVEECGDTIKREGLTVTDRFKQKKSHPLLAIELANRNCFALLWRRLGLALPEEGGEE